MAVARELRVDAVLEGTLQRSGGKLRVTVNLLRVTRAHLLERYIRNRDWGRVRDTGRDLASARCEAAGDLSQAARNALSARDTSSIEAFQAFQAGLQDFDARNFRSSGDAIPLFERAIELDPEYARAYALLAYCFAWHALFVDIHNAEKWIAKAEAAAKRAGQIRSCAAGHAPGAARAPLERSWWLANHRSHPRADDGDRA